jgi:hypothetical protein
MGDNIDNFVESKEESDEGTVLLSFISLTGDAEQVVVIARDQLEFRSNTPQSNDSPQEECFYA